MIKTKDIVIDDEYITTLRYCDNCKEYVETNEYDIPHNFTEETIGTCYRCTNCDYPIEDIYF